MARRTLADAEKEIASLQDTIRWQDGMIERCRESMRTIDNGLHDAEWEDHPDLGKLIHRIAELELMLFGEETKNSKQYQNITDTNTVAAGKPAGRKPHNAAWQQSFDRWKELYDSGMAVNDICQELGISRMTYYRYKKEAELKV